MLKELNIGRFGLSLCAIVAAGLSGCDGSSAQVFGYKSDAHATVIKDALPSGQTLGMNDQSARQFEEHYRELYTRSLGPGVHVNARVIQLSGKKIMYAAFRLNGALGSAALMLPKGNEVVRVVCQSGGKSDAKFKDSACGPVAEKTFGVSLSSSTEDF